MIRSIVWYVFFWVYLIGSLSFYIPLVVMRLFGLEKARKAFLAHQGGVWARAIVRVAGGRVTVVGKEHLPAHSSVCFVANHQGSLDIPLIMGYVCNTVGFIAKKELRYIPILGSWIEEVGCVFIDRSKRRESVEAINKGAGNIRRGNPMVIFPEGTRSKCGAMKPFKSGSLKLAIRANAAIVPLTIDGSYKLREEHGGLIVPAAIRITVHPAIDGALLGEEDTKTLADRLWHTINGALEKKS